jgi:hypothetical protein
VTYVRHRKINTTYFHSYVESKKVNLLGVESEIVTRGRGEEREGRMGKVYKLYLCRIKEFPHTIEQ